MTHFIECPKCKSTLKLVIGRNSQECEICSCGFPENETIYEWRANGY